MWIMAGSRKARVLPEPVAEMPTMSRPSSAMGQPCDWMGVGELKPCGGGGMVVDVNVRRNGALGFAFQPGVLFRFVFGSHLLEHLLQHVLRHGRLLERVDGLCVWCTARASVRQSIDRWVIEGRQGTQKDH